MTKNESDFIWLLRFIRDGIAEWLDDILWWFRKSTYDEFYGSHRKKDE